MWVDVVKSEQTAASRARVIARAKALDKSEANAVLSLRGAFTWPYGRRLTAGLFAGSVRN